MVELLALRRSARPDPRRIVRRAPEGDRARRPRDLDRRRCGSSRRRSGSSRRAIPAVAHHEVTLALITAATRLGCAVPRRHHRDRRRVLRMAGAEGARIPAAVSRPAGPARADGRQEPRDGGERALHAGVAARAARGRRLRGLREPREERRSSTPKGAGRGRDRAIEVALAALDVAPGRWTRPREARISRFRRLFGPSCGGQRGGMRPSAKPSEIRRL